MKLAFCVEGVFLGASKSDYVSKSTGRPGVFYSVALKQGGEVGSLNCSKEIYDMYVAKQVQDFVNCRFDCSFEDHYNRLVVVGMHVVK